MRISVALATHNAERYLAPLLQSVARQTRPPDELVARDDASTDSTPELLEAFARDAPFPVRVSRRGEWRGHVPSFLEAAGLCTGDAIAFCDGDDVWLDEKLERCGDALERSGATLVLHTTRIVDGELRDLGHCWPAIGATRLVEPLGLVGLDIDAPGMAMLFRRELLDAAPFDDRPPSRFGNGRLMLHDEWVFFLAGVLGPIQLIGEPLLLYRQHGANDAGWAERHRRITLRPALDDYAAQAEHTAACAAYLDRAAAAGGPHAERLAAGARAFRRTAESWSLRGALYGTPGRRRRARIVRRLLADQAYRSRETGGFGRAALAKDLAGIALGVDGGR